MISRALSDTCAWQCSCQGGKDGAFGKKTATQSATLHMTRQAGGRGGEASTLTYTGLAYNGDFGHLVAVWPQTKVLKERSFAFFMNHTDFRDCSWLALFLHFFMTRADTPDESFVFPTMSQSNPASYLNATIKEFYENAPASLVRRATATLTPKVSHPHL